MKRFTGLAAQAILSMAFSGCSRDGCAGPSPADSARREPGAAHGSGAPDETPPSPEAIRKLFADAVECPNRYRCAALDELLRLASGPLARAVVTEAFHLMAEGKIRSFDREGKFALLLVREWLLERRNTKTLDRDTALWCVAQLERTAKSCDPSLIGDLQLTALNAELPGAVDWVEKEISDPHAPLDKACAAGRFLSGYLKDYDRVKRWVATAGENGLGAAICALHHFDHDLFDVARDELLLLERAARRPGLAPDIAYPLLDHVEIHHSDARFRAIATHLAHHPDEGVRTQAVALAK